MVAPKTAPPRSGPPKLTRRERALATRRRMLAAAYRLFCEQGYGATTMEAIAAEAGVAVQTLYFTFNTKGTLLGEAFGAAIAGIERWPGPPREPIDAGDTSALAAVHAWFAPFEAESDARPALARFVAASMEIMARAAPLLSAMHAAEADPEARAVRELAERRRADSFGAVVALLTKKKGGLRAGLSTRRATDILLVLLSEETYGALVARGWSKGRIARWLVEILSDQLLGPEASTAPRRRARR